MSHKRFRSGKLARRRHVELEAMTERLSQGWEDDESSPDSPVATPESKRPPLPPRQIDPCAGQRTECAH